MKRSLTIARRELSSYFFSPIAYVALGLFLLVCGYLFWRDFQPGMPAGMRTVFDWMVWVLVFIVPVLSMGLLAQEWSSGTIETLMTAPVGETDVSLGKFLGALLFFAILLAPTLVYVVLLKVYTGVDLGPILSGYLGIILVGAMFLSIGLFCSSLTRSQVVAAVSAAAILVLITIAPWWMLREHASELKPWVRELANQSVYNRYEDFSRGVIDSGHVIFFLVGTALFLFLTTKVLEARRWK